jgi:hypothetical protein
MEVLPDLSAADAHRIIRFGTIAGLVAALIAFVVVQESAPAVMAPAAATSLENTTNQAIVDRAPETVGPVGPGVPAPTGNPLWAAPLELLSVTPRASAVLAIATPATTACCQCAANSSGEPAKAGRARLSVAGPYGHDRRRVQWDWRFPGSNGQRNYPPQTRRKSRRLDSAHRYRTGCKI